MQSKVSFILAIRIGGVVGTRELRRGQHEDTRGDKTSASAPSMRAGSNPARSIGTTHHPAASDGSKIKHPNAAWD
jgi:hypothetical protein